MNPSKNCLMEVRDKVASACIRSNRNPSEVTLLAVSKTWPVQCVSSLVGLGQVTFGESRLQEARPKIAAFPNLEWHFIGVLQRNKAREVVKNFHAVHSVSSLKLAQTLDRVASEEGMMLKIYLQVNLAEETSKQGFHKEELKQVLPDILALPNLEILGLMLIPSRSENAEGSRKWFAQLCDLKLEIEQEFGLAWRGLSMGMSGDYEVAIEEGATIVRVGSAIFEA